MIEKLSICEKFNDGKIEKRVVSGEKVIFYVGTIENNGNSFSLSLSEMKDIASEVENRGDGAKRRIGY